MTMGTHQLLNARTYDFIKWQMGYTDSEQMKPTETEINAFIRGYNMAWKRQQKRLTKEPNPPPEAEKVKR